MEVIVMELARGKGSYYGVNNHEFCAAMNMTVGNTLFQKSISR